MKYSLEYAFLLCFAVSAFGQTLVPNGNFDTQVAPWSGSTSAYSVDWSPVDLSGRPVSGSVLITMLVKNEHILSSETIESKDFPVIVGQTYLVSARFRILSNPMDVPFEAVGVAISFIGWASHLYWSNASSGSQTEKALRRRPNLGNVSTLSETELSSAVPLVRSVAAAIPRAPK